MSTVASTNLDFRPRLTTIGGISSGHSKVIRRHNRALVLRALLRAGAASRADLARLTGLTRPTISDVVKDLLLDGVVVENGQANLARPGKPAMLLTVDDAAAQVIAVDVSQAGHISAALVTPDGSIQHRLSPITTIGGPDAAQHVAAVVEALAAEATRPILGVGVGIPLSPSLDEASRLPSPGELAARIETVVDAPVHITSDAELAAHAEQRFGEVGAFLLVHLGTRIGTAIHGIDHPTGRARELAHTAVGGDSAASCACGLSDCVHAWASSTALTHRLEGATSAAERRSIAHDAGARLGAALAAIVSALDIQTVVFSGADGLISDALLDGADAALARAGNATVTEERVQVRRGIGSEAVLLGAAVRVVATEFDMR